MPKGNCEICEKEIEIKMCCDGYQCGCMGLPEEPPVCSDECYKKYIDKINSYKGVTQETLKQEFLDNLPDLPF